MSIGPKLLVGWSMVSLLSLVVKLLAAGANPNAALPTGETALMTVARAGSLEAVNALLARGADANAAETAQAQTARKDPITPIP